MRVSQEDSELRQLFRVRKTLAGYSGKLQTGDIILTINGKLTTRAHQLNDQFVKPSLDMVLIRQGKEISKQVPTYCADNMETSHILYTCGLTIQSPQYSVRDECEELFSKVYISCYDSGTPAHMFGVRCSRFITKINGLHTPTLDIFCAEFNKIPDATFFRLDLMDKQKKPSVVSLRKDELYHPTRMTFKDSSSVTGWTTVSLAEYMEKHGAVEMPNGVTN